jgi:hypothetical protein
MTLEDALDRSREFLATRVPTAEFQATKR